MGAEMNGGSPRLSNGHGPGSSELLGNRQLINRVEYIRVLQQGLHRLGYAGVAEQLQRQSGVEMQPTHVTAFQEAILGGHWAQAQQLLPQLSSDAATLAQAQFWVLRQKYIEALDAGDMAAALHTLRTELAPLHVNQPELRALAGMLLRSPSDGAAGAVAVTGGGELASWGQGPAATRPALVASLQRLLPPTLMVPDGRLEQLVEQALDSQVARCTYHNMAPRSLSLLHDYQAGIEQLPTHFAQALEAHDNEVWHVVFSHNGLLLGSASRDGTAIIWRVKATGEATLQHRLQGHDKPLCFLAFSPDDSLLLTCGNDPVVKLWSVVTGRLHHTYAYHSHQVTSVAWMPDGRRFLSSSLDKTVLMCDTDGNRLRRYHLQRVNDMVLAADGRTLVTVACEHKIRLMRLHESREAYTLTEGPAITSLAVSPDGAYLIAHLVSHTLQLWPLAPVLQRLDAAPAINAVAPDEEVPIAGMPHSPAMEYKVDQGRPGRFIIRSCFGGADCTFVAGGSEDCRVHIWHRATGDLLAQLEGHSGTVNSVAWNPTNPFMLASASDDHTVRIWLAPVALGPGGSPLVQQHA
ncbi:hypothetical protein WJX73_000377 [Symbiochloris irregularis]|uniref:Uncharacterized protein n=1 Tax=Symbiochloris irregularis TaxID=706552 RepID=A0AAW1PZE3_9CHLO